VYAIAVIFTLIRARRSACWRASIRSSRSGLPDLRSRHPPDAGQEGV